MTKKEIPFLEEIPQKPNHIESMGLAWVFLDELAMETQLHNVTIQDAQTGDKRVMS